MLKNSLQHPPPIAHLIKTRVCATKSPIHNLLRQFCLQRAQQWVTGRSTKIHCFCNKSIIKKDGATNRLPYCNKKKILWCSNTNKNYRNKCLLLPHVATMVKGCGNIETTPCNMPAPRRSTGNTSCNNGERVRQQFKITPAACLPRGEVRGQRSSRARGRRMPIWCLATALPDLARLVGCLVTGRAVGPTRVAPGGGCRGLGLGLGARRRRQPPSCTAPTPQRLKRPRNHCWHSAR